jgi:xanthine dehydrogenase molybdenum-binding subunit
MSTAYKLLGKDFTPPDVLAKVTGQARYAEDFRAEGMVFCRFFPSPYPHARVKSLDASEALKMEGVLGILTEADVKNPPAPGAPILTNEPKYVGEPVFALAAVDETTVQDALEKVRIEWEVLPFTVDPLKSLTPDNPADARTDGNVGSAGVQLQTIRWTKDDFASAKDGELPQGAAAEEWTYGDLDAGFAKAKVIYDETFVTASNSHHSMEPRSCMSYWENGKCFVFGSTQSQSFIVPPLAGFIGIAPDQLVYVAEFCGGGFGSKGGAYPSMAIPALMSKKIGRPVMMRVSRFDEYSIGHARNGFQGRVKLGFAENGKLVAADLYVVQEGGAHQGFYDFRNAPDALSIMYQPEAMRWRGLPVFCNTPTRSAQRGPGYNQLAYVIEPLLDRAARELNIDRVAIRMLNGPDMNAPVGKDRRPVSSCYMKDALTKGAERFRWSERIARSGQRKGSKVTGIGVGQAYHPAGFAGFDGLCRITPDGILHIHTGVGNLGTFSHTGTSRLAAEVLKYDWAKCVVVRGDTRKHLPWNIGQFGSNTSYTMARTNYVAAMDALQKMKEIAARDLGGRPEDYDVDGNRVFAKGAPGRGMSYARVAQRAIELGGRYSGQELPADINPMTRASATAVAGTGLIGVAKDNLPHGQPAAFAACFMEIELDVETGQHRIVDVLNVGDCGTVIHPMGLDTQLKGATVQGIGAATLEGMIYDPQNGIPGAASFYQAKPPSYLELPPELHSDWIDKPDPMSPMGTKGIGEPPLGSAAAALLCAISDAMGGHVFNRTPVRADMIINALAGQPPAHRRTQIHTA